ncbi:MAG: alpha/beta hydrolase [Verrucomicrobiae bacterium]|nr:alpha/beta hydrolase [Verrucomicrobiae bacterium]
MKKPRLILNLILALLSFTTLKARFQEKMVDVTPDVAGKLVTPEGTSRAVLIFHGFNDHMDGVGDLQKQLAHALGEAGIGSLRIDFRGEGARNNNVITSTRESRLQDAESAYQFIRKAFPGAKLGVSGWSLGGSTTILMIGTHPDWVESVVLWSSGGSNSRDQLGSAHDKSRAETIKQVLTEGSAVMETWTKITYTRENYISWIGFEYEDYLPKYKGAFLGIRGTEDFLPLYEPDWMKILPGGPKAYHVLGGADHIFNVLEPEKSQGDAVVKQTVDWFKETLE